MLKGLARSRASASSPVLYSRTRRARSAGERSRARQQGPPPDVFDGGRAAGVRAGRATERPVTSGGMPSFPQGDSRRDAGLPNPRADNRSQTRVRARPSAAAGPAEYESSSSCRRRSDQGSRTSAPAQRQGSRPFTATRRPNRFVRPWVETAGVMVAMKTSRSAGFYARLPGAGAGRKIGGIGRPRTR